MEWRPIETAPPEAPEHGILVWDATNEEPTIAVALGMFNSWWTENFEVLINASHWMPLPGPPK